MINATDMVPLKVSITIEGTYIEDADAYFGEFPMSDRSFAKLVAGDIADQPRDWVGEIHASGRVTSIKVIVDKAAA